jgi:hypothetical protein
MKTAERKTAERKETRCLRREEGRSVKERLRACYAVPDAKVRVTCNLFADHAERQREIEDFWLSELRLPQACLRKSTVNRYSKHSKKKRRNKLPYGTCRLNVYDTRLVHEIRGVIQESGGFEREEWLM